MLNTKANGEMAVIGEMVEIIGMNCKTTFAKNTTFDNLVN